MSNIFDGLYAVTAPEDRIDVEPLTADTLTIGDLRDVVNHPELDNLLDTPIRLRAVQFDPLFGFATGVSKDKQEIVSIDLTRNESGGNEFTFAYMDTDSGEDE